MIAVVGVALKKREQERSQNFVDFISECSTNVLFLQMRRDLQPKFSEIRLFSASVFQPVR